MAIIKRQVITSWQECGEIVCLHTAGKNVMWQDHFVKAVWHFLTKLKHRVTK